MNLLWLFIAALIAKILCGTFQNPIIKSGADPWVIQHNGFYYYCFSGDGGIGVTKSKKLQDIGNGERKIVWKPPPNTPYSHEIWAPELHLIHGKWYIYFAADDGNNDHHRMYVLESDAPHGNYVFKGKLAAHTDKWAIDGTVLQTKNGGLFFIWSGWEGDKNYRQDLYIAKMSNPWTITGERAAISIPNEAWEKRSLPYVPGGINEGPEVILHNNKIFIVYSASGSWSDEYCLGYIVCDNENEVMNPKCWKKNGPVFSKAREAFGPGHASFTKSPDGKEDWIVYHACVQAGGGWAGRSVRIQKYEIRADGNPYFGEPVRCFVPIPEPSGS